MVLHNCKANAQRHGKDRKGVQRFKYNECGKTFSEERTKPLDTMSLDPKKAISVLNLLAEGVSIRACERLTDVNRNTIMSLIVLVGERCERILEQRIQSVPVRDVQLDEVWAFVQCKEKTKTEDDPKRGDAYCFIAFERHTKLVLTWHLGRRTTWDTFEFTENLGRATADHTFQVTTDGFGPYRDCVVHSLGAKKIDFAQMIKVYVASREGEQKYSPAEVINTEIVPVYGDPDPERICTSHVERQNLTVRMQMRRLTRLTNGFSKKWENLKAAYAFFFAHYNFCRVHSTIRMTPAMEAGLTGTHLDA
ncbi:MAG: IS1 family transposase [Blastocatellia bacterium AA13]|nr:MAG: IS1 family transposase [Blastocatellia bacterium AA13]